MDLTTIIAQLRSRRSHLVQAIESLEQLYRTQPKKRGRPPKWAAATKPDLQPVPLPINREARSA